jgi:hypothetical protein
VTDPGREHDEASWLRDPGWRSSLPAAVLLAVLPWWIQRQKGDGLVALRSVFVAFVTTLVGIGVVLMVVAPPGAAPEPVALVAIVVLGLGVHAAAPPVVDLRRELDCSSDLSLASSYRSRFFLGLAFSEVVALVGFVVTFLGAGWVSYWVGFVFAVIGFARVAPTTAHIDADQRRLTKSGCERSLFVALRRTPPPSR